ncbi:MAG: acyl carrier protein [Butyrivibrio sp.]|nr:acyl carrier protein [Butyrivibrio sp.]
MTREEVYKKLDEVFQDVFDDETIHVDDSTTAEDIEDWDSFEHINLINAVEEAFGIKIKMNEVKKLENVGQMVNIIIERAVEC